MGHWASRWGWCSPSCCSRSSACCGRRTSPRRSNCPRRQWLARRRSRGWCRAWLAHCSTPTSSPSKSPACSSSPPSWARSCWPSANCDAARARPPGFSRVVHAGRRRRAAAAQRDHHLHVRRADAQRREPHVRGAGAAARRRRPGVRLLRDGGRGRRGGGRPRDHSRDLPSPPDGQSPEHQPAEGLMPGSLLPAAPPAPPLWLVPALPLLGFVLNGVLALARPAAKRVVSLIGVGVLVLACAAAVGAVVAFSRLPGAEPLVVRPWEWLPVGDLQVDFALQLDPLSAVMILVVTGVGALIHVFSVGYMHDDPGYARYFAYLNLFVFFMLILVLGANFPVMFVGWEGVGLCSYLLISFWFNEKINADAGLKAFIVNRIGDFGFLIAMFMIYRATGSLSVEEVFD